MSKPTRKEQLRRRMFAYAEARKFDHPDRVSAVAFAWEDGYRAAMRDARKAISDHPQDRLYLYSDQGRLILKAALLDTVQEFLRPIR